MGIYFISKMFPWPGEVVYDEKEFVNSAHFEAVFRQMRLIRNITLIISAMSSYRLDLAVVAYNFHFLRGVVSTLCVGFGETINKIGPAFVENRMSLFVIVFGLVSNFSISDLEAICNIAVQVLEQKALCQQDPDQDMNEEAPEDQAEYDSVLVSAAGDLVAALANVLGPDFAQAFGTFFPLIAKYYVGFLLSRQSGSLA